MSIQFGDEKSLNVAFNDDVIEKYNSGELTLGILSNIFYDYMGMTISEHDIEKLNMTYMSLYYGFIDIEGVVYCQNCGPERCRCSGSEDD